MNRIRTVIIGHLATLVLVWLLVACSGAVLPNRVRAARATATPSVHVLDLQTGERFMLRCIDGSPLVYGHNGGNDFPPTEIIGGCGLDIPVRE